MTGSIDALAQPADSTMLAATSGVRHLVEDRQTPAPGSYIAGAPFVGNSDWVLRTLALRPQ